MKKNRIVTKIVAGIMIALGLMVLGTSLLLLFNCNSALAVGYSSSIFDDDETGLCTGIVISKRKGKNQKRCITHMTPDINHCNRRKGCFCIC